VRASLSVSEKERWVSQGSSHHLLITLFLCPHTPCCQSVCCSAHGPSVI